ncbi:MAG TPA: GAF domain-containing protein [Anaerolineales bacterium]|nr:GAF domain-containing protein [Anaerolineales bacterium]
MSKQDNLPPQSQPPAGTGAHSKASGRDISAVLNRPYEMRMSGLRLTTRLGIGANLLAGIGNLALYFQLGAWQMLAVAIAQGISMAGLAFTAWLVFGRKDTDRLSASNENQRLLTVAGYVVIACFWIGLGGGELFHKGLTIFLGLGGVLLFILIGVFIIPRHWLWVVFLSVLYVAYFVLVNLFSPIQRYDVARAGDATIFFRILIGVIVALLVLVGFWRFFRLFRQVSIRARLLTIFVILVLLPALLVSGISTWVSINRFQQQVLTQLGAIASLKMTDILTWADNLHTNLLLAQPAVSDLYYMRVLFTDPTDADMTLYRSTYDTEVRRFNQIISEGGIFDELFIVSLDGVVRLSTDPDHVGLNEMGYPYFEGGLVESTVSPFYFSQVTGNRIMVVAAPIKEADGDVVALLGGRVNLTYLNTIMLDRSGLGETGETLLVDSWDFRLLTPSIDENLVIQETYLFSDGITEAALGRDTAGAFDQNHSGKAVLGVYRAVPGLDLILVAEQDQSEVLIPTLQTVGINLGVTAGAVLLAVFTAFMVTNRITVPIANLSQTAQRIAGGDYQLQAAVETKDEIGDLAQSFNAMTSRLRSTLSGLEEQVAERTAAVVQRSAYLQASAEVGKAVTSVLDPDQLIQQVVNLIRERFNLYYVGLFLVDDAGEYAELRAGTGLAGEKMLARHHRLRIGTGMIGWSVANQLSRVALHAEMDAARLTNPDLPDTRSEAAIPLRSRGRVVGALSMQSEKPDAFDDATIAVFETMADQVAAALDNARLYAESQQAIDSLNRAYGQMTRESWLKLVQLNPNLGYRAEASGQIVTETSWQPELEQAIRSADTLTGSLPAERNTQGEHYLAIPIKVRDTVIGALGGYKPASGPGWTAPEIDFVQEIANTLSIALESARFFNEAQAQAETERLVGEISARMRQTLDIDAVLQTTSRELRRVLDLVEVEVQLAGPDLLKAAGDQTDDPSKVSHA